MPHNWKLVEEKRHDKSKGFDPKTMPIADYWKKFKCACGVEQTEIGYVINGQDVTYGGSYIDFSKYECPLDKEQDHG